MMIWRKILHRQLKEKFEHRVLLLNVFSDIFKEKLIFWETVGSCCNKIEYFLPSSPSQTSRLMRGPANMDFFYDEKKENKLKMRVNFSKLWQPAWDHKMALRKTSSIHHVGINRLNVGPPLSKVDYKGNIARPVWVWYTCWNGWAPFSSSCIWGLGKNWKKISKLDQKYTRT